VGQSCGGLSASVAETLARRKHDCRVIWLFQKDTSGDAALGKDHRPRSIDDWNVRVGFSRDLAHIPTIDVSAEADVREHDINSVALREDLHSGFTICRFNDFALCSLQEGDNKVTIVSRTSHSSSTTRTVSLPDCFLDKATFLRKLSLSAAGVGCL
jgi:hypothetical protein